MSLAVALLILLSGAPAFAQVADTTSPTHAAVRSHRRPSLDERVKELAKNLNLSDAQQSAVKKILEQRHEETMRIRLDQSITGSARIDRFRALQEETVERIRATLNEEQRKYYDPIAPRKLPPSSSERSVEDWLKATTPP